MNEEVFDIKKELNFALSLIKNNNHSGAIKIYEKILQKNLENFEANSNLGMLYAQNNNLAKAEKHLNEAIKIEPKNPSNHEIASTTLKWPSRRDISIN